MHTFTAAKAPAIIFAADFAMFVMESKPLFTFWTLLPNDAATFPPTWIAIQMGRPEEKGGEAAEGDSGEESEGESDDLDMYVKFSKPYVFEDDTYNGIDMSCLENLTTDDLTEIEKKFYKQADIIQLVKFHNRTAVHGKLDISDLLRDARLALSSLFQHSRIDVHCAPLYRDNDRDCFLCL